MESAHRKGINLPFMDGQSQFAKCTHLLLLLTKRTFHAEHETDLGAKPETRRRETARGRAGCDRCRAHLLVLGKDTADGLELVGLLRRRRLGIEPDRQRRLLGAAPPT